MYRLKLHCCYIHHIVHALFEWRHGELQLVWILKRLWSTSQFRTNINYWPSVDVFVNLLAYHSKKLFYKIWNFYQQGCYLRNCKKLLLCLWNHLLTVRLLSILDDVYLLFYSTIFAITPRQTGHWFQTSPNLYYKRLLL